MRRVGSTKTDAVVNVRFIAATNRDPEEAVESGTLRQDLFFRLRVVPIRVPALRERPEDIPLLAEFFLQRLARKQGMARMRLSGEAVEALQKHRWPGNVRELENTLARACALSTSDLLLPDDFPFTQSPFSEDRKIGTAFDTLLSVAPDQDTNLLEWVQGELARRVFDETRGDLKEAARRLGATQAAVRTALEFQPPPDEAAP